MQSDKIIQERQHINHMTLNYMKRSISHITLSNLRSLTQITLKLNIKSYQLPFTLDRQIYIIQMMLVSQRATMDRTQPTTDQIVNQGKRIKDELKCCSQIRNVNIGTIVTIPCQNIIVPSIDYSQKNICLVVNSHKKLTTISHPNMEPPTFIGNLCGDASHCKHANLPYNIIGAVIAVPSTFFFVLAIPKSSYA